MRSSIGQSRDSRQGENAPWNGRHRHGGRPEPDGQSSCGGACRNSAAMTLMACSSNDHSGAVERYRRNQGRVNFRSGVLVKGDLVAVRIKLAANLAPRDFHANDPYREP